MLFFAQRFQSHSQHVDGFHIVLGEVGVSHGEWEKDQVGEEDAVESGNERFGNALGQERRFIEMTQDAYQTDNGSHNSEGGSEAAQVFEEDTGDLASTSDPVFLSFQDLQDDVYSRPVYELGDGGLKNRVLNLFQVVLESESAMPPVGGQH